MSLTGNGKKTTESALLYSNGQ